MAPGRGSWTLPVFSQAALPGRHYQSALQQGRSDLPKFRRFGSEPAFVDGWGLYAATLGEELGLVATMTNPNGMRFPGN